MPWQGDVALAPSLAPREGSSAVGSHQPLWKGMCACHHRTCHDTEIIWVNQIFHRSGESRLWEEPQQKGMGAGRGERKCVGVLTFFFFFVLRIEENRSNYERKIIQLFGVNSFSLQANQIFVFRGRKENA